MGDGIADLEFPDAVAEDEKGGKIKDGCPEDGTAWKGVRTLVETTVAMEIAASWKPLM
ncbi:MAG TPA: hypothetical protein VMH27_15435 [Puia sp.]|nr:hypothetical protein [Puia sp.]